MTEPALVLMAKAPRAGLVKTRLCPPCLPEEAALIAAASITDTVAAMRGTGARLFCAVDGPTDGWLPPGLEAFDQVGDGLDERLAHAFDTVGISALLIGMDTPQVTPQLLQSALDTLADPDVDVVLGAAEDGGYWTIGFSEPEPAALLGVPMSLATTCEEQRKRLAELGLRVADVPVLRDVDHFDDALAVAALIPRTAFARAVAVVGQRDESP